MRHLSIIVAAMIALCSASAAAERNWVRVVNDADWKIYIDTTSIKRVGNDVLFVQLIDNKPVNLKKGVPPSMVVMLEAYCSQHSFKNIQMVGFKKPMAQGKQLWRTVFPVKPPTTAAPGSNADSVVTWACNYHEPQ